MDLFDVLRACARRWFVFIPLVAISIAIAYNNYSGVTPVFFGNVSVGLTAPSTKTQQTSSTGSVQVNSNGLVDAGGVSYLATLVATAMDEPSTREAVRAAGGTLDYNTKLFTAPVGTQIPILVIDASGASGRAVQETLRAAVAQAEPVAQSVQSDAGVPAANQYRALTPAEIPTPGGGYPSRTREALATILGGILISVVVTVAVDAILAYVARRRRKPLDDSDDLTKADPERLPSPAAR
ncbi:hypothetical protein [uncultured Williamsia sp.]|uniref:hypothetical protein n=1 Tax=uncultured Williamsia sp. TaxID=259311 RepID=UPI0026120180|nr:hypothetical protein [uncultured Williamsia sp.]